MLFLALRLSLDHIPFLVVAFLYVEVLVGSLLDFLGQMEELDRKNRKARRKSEIPQNATV